MYDIDNDARVPVIWDPRYTTNAAPLTSTTKAARVMAQPDIGQIVQHVDFDLPDDVLPDVWEQIARFHTPKYVNAVRTGRPRYLAESQGFTWSPTFAKSVVRIWHGQQVAHTVAGHANRLVLHPVSGAHHAHPARGAGFCTLNYVVGGAVNLVERRPTAKVAIIDLDAHEGDGTLAFAKQFESLHVFDISAGWGEANEVLLGWSKTDGTTRDRVFSHTANNAVEYMRTLHTLTTWLDTHEFTDAVYLAGVDPYEADPVGGIPGMTTDMLVARDVFVLSQLAQRGIATVVNFAGGYVEDKVVELHTNTIHAMLAAETLAAGETRRALARGTHALQHPLQGGR